MNLLLLPSLGITIGVILNELKNLPEFQNRPFATLRVTWGETPRVTWGNRLRVMEGRLFRVMISI